MLIHVIERNPGAKTGFYSVNKGIELRGDIDLFPTVIGLKAISDVTWSWNILKLCQNSLVYNALNSTTSSSNIQIYIVLQKLSVSALWCYLWRHGSWLYMEMLLYIVDSRLAPSQGETSLQSNAVSHWLGTNLESALHWIARDIGVIYTLQINCRQNTVLNICPRLTHWGLNKMADVLQTTFSNICSWPQKINGR